MAERFGRYELVAEIGRGGMAQLFLGRLVGIAGFAKPLAIKRILPHLAEDKRFVDMFLNEGRIAARLSHPNICQVYELGEVAGELFLAMEYLEGVPWGELITTAVAAGSVRDPVAILRLSASVICQACDGLHYAHELRDSHGKRTPVVHRDISPGNLFVTVDGACKVLDFGVSKIATDQHETRSGLVKGKLTYMPPEQLKGHEVDRRADVFAMAVVLWEALAGKRLFLRASDYLIFKAILEEPIPTIGHMFPRSHARGVDALLVRGLQRDREQRHASIRDFADELRALVAPLGGVPSPGEIGNLVRDTFETRLADRSRLVAQVTTVREIDRDDTEGDLTVADPSITRSVAIRRDSVAFPAARSPRRSRWRIAVLALVVVVALVAFAAAVLLGARTGTTDRDDAAATPLDASSSTRPARDAHDARDAPDAPAADAALPVRALDDIEIDPAPARPAKHRPSTSDRASTQPGFYSVDSNPYATIFVDDRRIDQTPIYRVKLAPGRHRVRAVLANGRSRSFTIKITPGNEVTSGTLRW